MSDASLPLCSCGSGLEEPYCDRCGDGDEVQILSRVHTPPVFDFYDYIDSRPILERPAMWLGRKSITAFGHFYTGLSELGGRSLGGPRVFVFKNELYSGFSDWALAKHNKPDMCIWKMYALIENAKDPTAGPYVIEERAFDLFVADLKEFRKQQRQTE